jgi:hypothetical protein
MSGATIMIGAMSVGRAKVIALGIVGFLGLCAFVTLVFIAEIDNVIGLRTSRDVALVKGQRLRDGTTLGDWVGPNAEWSGLHQEEFWRTFVTCRVMHGERAESFHWEVDHGVSPRTGYDRAPGVFITPLTRGTAALAPELVPDELRGDRLPTTASMTARAIYQALGLAPTPPLPENVRKALEEQR